MDAAGEVVTKSEFALRIGRSAGRVSQLIDEGKISGNAIVGSGRMARINVAVAMQQLSTSLDVGQQMAQARPIFEQLPSLALAGALPQPSEAPARSAMDFTDDAKRAAKAKADTAEMQAADMKAKMLERSGTWLNAEDMRREFGATLREVFAGIDSFLPAAAEALGAELGIDIKRATSILRQQWRKHRSKMASTARAAAENADQFSEVNLEEVIPTDPS